MRSVWYFGDPAGSEEKFRALLPTGDRAVDLEIQCQIARTYSLRKDVDTAHRLLDDIFAVSELKEHPRAYASYLLERGRSFNTGGQKELAMPLFVEATESPATDLAVDAWHMVAFIQAPKDAIETNRKAIEIAKASSDLWTRRWAGTLLNNLGWAQHEEGQFEEALVSFRDALAERKEFGSEEQVHIASWCIARCLRSLGRFEEALEVLDALSKDDPYVTEEIESCNLKKVD